MDRQTALENLNDNDADTRLRAARSLAQVGTSEDEAPLRARRRLESVPWIRHALQLALVRIGDGVQMVALAEGEGLLDRECPANEYLSGVQVATDRLVHELRAIVGTLRYWSQKEQPGYQGSQTERQTERLRRCIDAIDLLGKASRSSAMTEFDFAQLVDDELVVLEERLIQVDRLGPSPCLVTGDSGLLSLVLRNGLQNAVEASSDKPAIHIGWGETADGYWLAVFDRGAGLPASAEALFDFGSTTKTGHVGAGLAIIAQASLAVGGQVSLTEEADGTTKLEFRWPRVAGN